RYFHPATHDCRCFCAAPAPTATSTLSLHDALPISRNGRLAATSSSADASGRPSSSRAIPGAWVMTLMLALSSVDITSAAEAPRRSEEHTSELQSRENLVCRLLLEKKTKPINQARNQ